MKTMNIESTRNANGGAIPILPALAIVGSIGCVLKGVEWAYNFVCR